MTEQIERTHVQTPTWQHENRFDINVYMDTNTQRIYRYIHNIDITEDEVTCHIICRGGES